MSSYSFRWNDCGTRQGSRTHYDSAKGCTKQRRRHPEPGGRLCRLNRFRGRVENAGVDTGICQQAD
jgi:hypothetical protein